jgi:hypothetical protein
MSFNIHNIWGLFGIIAILLLILIYVLKPKFQDRVLSSTHVWKISLRFKKQKVPFQWLQNSLLFIIQLLIIISIIFMMIGPYLTVRSSGEEKIIILDASAAMRTVDGNDRTRFSRALTEIDRIARDTIPDKVTLIVAGGEREPVIIVDRLDDMASIRRAIDTANLTPSFANVDWSDKDDPVVANTMTLVEQQLKQNNSSQVMLFTSKNYSDPGQIEVRNMSSGEWNAAILDVAEDTTAGFYKFTAKVGNFNAPANVTSLTLRASYTLTEGGPTIQLPEVTNPVPSNTIVDFEWDTRDFTGNQRVAFYRTATFEIVGLATAGAKEAFSYDNVFHLFRNDEERFSIQLVTNASDSFFWPALATIRNADLTFINTNRLIPGHPDFNESAQPPQYSGFDIYIFHGFMPEEIPTDGALWIVDPPTNILNMLPRRDLIEIVDGNPVTNSYGISAGVERISLIHDNINFTIRDAFRFYRPNAPSQAVSDMLIGISMESNTFMATRFRPLNFTEPQSLWEPVLHLSGMCNSPPAQGGPGFRDGVAIAARNLGGIKTVVFGFDIHWSGLPGHWNMLFLTRNLFNYSITHTLPENNFNVGEMINLKAKPSAVTMTVTGTRTTGDTAPWQGWNEDELKENRERPFKEWHPGIYAVTQSFNGSPDAISRFGVRVHRDQSNFAQQGVMLANPSFDVEQGNEVNIAMMQSGIFFLILAILLLGLILLEWALQYREQF